MAPLAPQLALLAKFAAMGDSPPSDAADKSELFHLLEEHGKMAEPAVVFYAACITMALQHLLHFHDLFP